MSSNLPKIVKYTVIRLFHRCTIGHTGMFTSVNLSGMFLLLLSLLKMALKNLT